MIQSGIQDLEMSNEEFCERVTVGYQTCSDRDLEVLRKCTMESAFFREKSCNI